MMHVRLREEGAVPRGMRRAWNNRVRKPIFRGMAAYWHRHFSQKHFTVAGAREYGYTRRKKRYTESKQRKQGHKDPLVWSGESRRRVRRRSIRSTSKWARVVINAPALNLRPAKGRIDMRAEMTTISAREERELLQVAETMLIRQSRRLRMRSTKRLA